MAVYVSGALELGVPVTLHQDTLAHPLWLKASLCPSQ